MSIWVLALLLFVCFGTAGYYLGALRSAFTFFGLLLASLLSMPLGPVGGALFRIFGLEHPVILAFAGPFAAFVLIMVVFKAAGQAVHRQVDTYYKYKASDTVRLLFERMNSRVGASLGVLNGFCYLIALSVVIYSVGYFTVQLSVPSKDVIFLRILNQLALDLEATQLRQAVSAFLPQAKKYYDGADILGLVANNPLLRNRLSTYPVFLLLPENQVFKAIGDSADFQQLWIKDPKPSLQEFRSHDLIKPLVETREWYDSFNTMLGGDFEDLKAYLETGRSPKYEDERILGRWEIDAAASFNLAKRRKPNMNLQEIKRLRFILATLFKNFSLAATPDGKVQVKMPGLPNPPAPGTPAAAAMAAGGVPSLAGMQKNASGSWERKDGGGYKLSLGKADSPFEIQAVVEGEKLTLSVLGYGLILEK